jgi:hypothetical protein
VCVLLVCARRALSACIRDSALSSWYPCGIQAAQLLCLLYAHSVHEKPRKSAFRNHGVERIPLICLVCAMVAKKGAKHKHLSKIYLVATGTKCVFATSSRLLPQHMRDCPRKAHSIWKRPIEIIASHKSKSAPPKTGKPSAKKRGTNH